MTSSTLYITVWPLLLFFWAMDLSMGTHYDIMFPEPEPVVYYGDSRYRNGGNRGMGRGREGPGSYDPGGFPAGRCGGVCLHPSYCSSLGGASGGFCPGNSASSVCCKFEKSCNHITSEEISYFQSPGYPGPTLGTLICQFDIFIQAGVCGVRLEFKEFNTTNPLDRGLCNVDQFIIMNSLEGATFPRCGELTGYSTIVPVDPRHRLPLTLLSIVQSSKEQYKWNIKFTQVKCDKVRQVKDDPNCGKRVSSEVEDLNKSEKSLESDNNNVVDGGDNTEQVYYSARRSVDNAFYIAYLKQAHEVISSNNPNNTFCKNRGPDIQAEKLQQLRMTTETEELLRIIRGDEASVNEFPWQVSIQDATGHVCGGAIISHTSILTASHCFLSIAPVPLSTVKIVVGDLNLNITTEAQEEVVALDTILFHSHFDPYYLENDIALIRLKSPLKFRAGVQPICLPEKGNSYTGQKSTISGWGATSYPQGTLATSLQRADNDIIENSECKKKLKIDYIYSTMLCAVAPNCSGTCFGDSGGPLVVTKNGESILVGLVSFGIGGCALFPYWPDVYTRVSEFLDWVSYANFYQ